MFLPLRAHAGILTRVLAALVAGLVFSASVSMSVRAEVTPAETARVTRHYDTAGAAHRASPQDVRAAWEFARACFDRAEVIGSDALKASIANEGILACRTALERSPATAELHYYLGLNLGQLAQTKSLGALRLVRQMEKVWLTARTLDETLDFAGADRSLGLLYAECPRPPLGIGGKDKARKHLERAVELSPLHPENRVNLAEQLLRWGDRDGVRLQLEALDAALPDARKRLSGPEWESAWVGWDRRIQVLRDRVKPHA